jgi:hypothetical protein
MIFSNKKTVSIEEYQKLKKWYSDELLRKDKEITQLKLEKEILIKSAFNKAEREIDFQKQLINNNKNKDNKTKKNNKKNKKD